MKFHRTCHGENITITEDATVALRNNPWREFHHGIVFGDRPVAKGEQVTIEIIHTTSIFAGAFFFGFTNHDPDAIDPKSLPRYASDLTDKPGYWVQWAAPEGEVPKGIKFSYFYTDDGVKCLIDGKPWVSRGDSYPKDKDFKASVNIQKPIWPLFDVFGQTASVKIVKETPSEILARGPTALQAYLTALQDGAKPVYRTRLMLVGQERVGKTSLMKILTGQRFNESEDITDGVDCGTVWKILFKADDSSLIIKRTDVTVNKSGADVAEDVEHRYTDTVCGIMMQQLKESQRRLEDEVPRSEQGAAMRTSPVTFEEGHHELQEGYKKRGVEESQDQGEEEQSETKQDSVPENITQQLLQQLHKSEDGAIDQNSVSEFQIWDFAGQDVYYTTHQVFLTYRAIYIVVFDLSLDLGKAMKVQNPSAHLLEKMESRFHELTGLEFLDFWMQSIYAYASSNDQICDEKKPHLSPAIFVVGTHRDSYSTSTDDPQEKRRMVTAKFQCISDMISGKPYEKHVVSKFYAVENSSSNKKDEELESLREHIVTVASQESYMGEDIPLRWLQFEKAVATAIKGGQHFMKLAEVQALSTDLGIKSDTELFTMLHFYHDLGTIIFFGKEEGTSLANDYLQDMVILDPQWLIDVFKRIITVLPRQQQWPTLKAKWKLLKEEGILEDCLIDHMWHDLLPQKSSLLGLMEMFDLLCPRVDATEGSTSQSYYVPACLQAVDGKIHHHLAVSKTDVTFYIDFQGFLPDGLFYRVLVHAARWFQLKSGEVPRLFYRFGKFWLDDEHNFQLEMETSKPICIKVKVGKTPMLSVARGSDNTTDDDQPDPIACVSVKSFLTEALEELTRTWIRGVKYEFSVACPCNDLSPASDASNKCIHLLPLEECLNKTKIKCNEKHVMVGTGVFKKWFQDTENDDSSTGTTPLTDVELLEVAGEIGIHWQYVGIYLGLKTCHLFAINSDHLMTKDKAFNMLIQWRQRLTQMKNARQLLGKALKKCQLVELAEKVACHVWVVKY